jgi:hypothetical protein
MKVSEQYLLNNYERYCENCKAENKTPKSFDDWKDWFIKTFKVEVEP